MKSAQNLALVVVASASLLTAHTAFAHAKLLKSSPSANEVVHAAPSEVSLHFSEELEVAMSKLEVKNSKTGEVVSQGAVSQNPDDKASLKIALKPLKKPKAVYEVTWKAVAKDAHKMPGHMSFTFDPKN